MAKSLKECFLRPISSDLPVIRINSEQTFVGRSEETKILDVNCSRKQVCLKANLDPEYVLVKRLGTNFSILNGMVLKKDVGYEAVDGDVLELLPGLHKYQIEFKFETGSSIEKNSSNETTAKPLEQANSDDKRDSGGKRSREECLPSRSGVSQGSSKRSKTLHEASPTLNLEPAKKQPSILTTEDVWESQDNKQLHIYTSAGVVASVKIASYDMDGTLIKTKSGNVFPKSIDDWQIAFAEVPGKLKSLHKNGYKLVIFTNQAGIGNGKIRIEDFRKKIEALVGKLGVPMQVFISTGMGKYRKPRTGMWKMLCENKNDGLVIDMARSFYVGDAAGRPELKKPVKRKKDHSCADRLMAMNVGLNFLTPEQHFQNVPDTNWTRPEFDPKAVFSSTSKNTLLSPAGAQLTKSRQEVIVMVGYPGSGKSHFVRTHLSPKGYAIINRDTLGSWQKCVEQMETFLKQGKNVVVDNMCPDVDSRKRYLVVAGRMNVPIRCFVMDVDHKHARHNNEFRMMTDQTHAVIPELVFNSYKSKFVEPSTSEGFVEIVKVKFVPKFDSKSHEELYKMFLLEK
ncbi:uncharacterized protein F21D5.5 [Anopheles nili]|uniref:uncharacterized protein F21D5.5 n=1 Tax=Anopheles nili TaxID=185578 RepID=UPI00237B3819|nr:uncharacterized protein F21D5.5 [Anopheles nili]